MPDGQLYKLSIVAEGELRDKDGNVISTEPLTSETVVTEEQAQAIVGEALKERFRAAEEGRGLDDTRTIGGEPSQ